MTILLRFALKNVEWATRAPVTHALIILYLSSPSRRILQLFPTFLLKSGSVAAVLAEAILDGYLLRGH